MTSPWTQMEWYMQPVSFQCFHSVSHVFLIYNLMNYDLYPGTLPNISLFSCYMYISEPQVMLVPLMWQ